MFNVNGAELIVIAVLFILLFGPDRLPEVAAQLGRLLREARRLTDSATADLARELDLASKELRAAGPSRQSTGAVPAQREASSSGGEPHESADAPEAPLDCGDDRTPTANREPTP